MTQNNNFSVLPWYTSIDQQNHKKSYAFGNIYPLFTPKNKLLPFQILRDKFGLVNGLSGLTAYDRGKSTTWAAGSNPYGQRVGVNIPAGYSKIITFRFTSTSELQTSVFWQNKVGGANLITQIQVVWVADGNGGFYFEREVTASSTEQASLLFIMATANAVITSSVTVKMTEVIFMSDNILSVVVYKKNGVKFADITQGMKDTGLKVCKFPQYNYDIIVYPGILPMVLNNPPGMYYVVLSDGFNTWYSEIFTVVEDLSAYLKIEWWDAENAVFDAGQIVYVNPMFKNVVYLANELGKPEYIFEEDGEERDGYFFPEKQISEKTYKFTMLAPEYLCDVMRFIRMSDYVVVTDKYGRVYNCDTFLITPKWETQGDIASVECEFQTATVVKKIGRGIVQLVGGDMNNDFNTDFNTTN